MRNVEDGTSGRGINTQNMHIFMTVISAMVLLVHAGYFVLLKMANVGILSYMNFISILIYAFCGINFYRKKLKGLSYFILFSEIFIFSTVMTWCIKGADGFPLIVAPIIPFAGLLGYMYKVKFHRQNYYFYFGVYFLSLFLGINTLKTHLLPEIGFISVAPFYRNLMCIYSCVIESVCLAIMSLIYFSIANYNHDSQDLRIEKLSLKLFITLSQTVEAKDMYTNGHSMRVASYSEMIAKEMGFDAEEQRKIYFCGLLHDIGKISIPDSIINKAGKLTDEEYNEIKKHSASGWNILHSIDEFPELAHVARWHHERYDGRGYPDGKQSDETPMYVRIVTIADAYDAMTSNRSYRSVMEREKVLSIIREERGKQFDPDVTDAFLKILDGDKNYSMREKDIENINIIETKM
ncbi:HD-GYP domain-containing protein [Treponema sp.]|uniref:HD-GYP domain-containing protein n=1 Tax=Treponema sp. TaxID=166 RepID=UPI00298D6B3B|nr:HD-GYP domain-containing protein [Treponema sp.]MCQ2240868.1 HD-GYP domain-containing protein [Treponema sp.]